MHQITALTICHITVTSRGQRHLLRVHIKLNTIFAKWYEATNLITFSNFCC